MLRTHTCGELTLKLGESVVLCVDPAFTRSGRNDFHRSARPVWDHSIGFQYGNECFPVWSCPAVGKRICSANQWCRDGTSNKNLKMPTGEIEIRVDSFDVLNAAKTPPFTIEDNSDGGEDLRMKYRYLDIRRNPVKEALLLRAQVTTETRTYLNKQQFVEIETPVLIKSTPEGHVILWFLQEWIRRVYALPQSPQTFKQLLMVAGMDKYYQIVKCSGMRILRADRQPEFTQIDCEMSFIEQEDILNMFEGMTRHLLILWKVSTSEKFQEWLIPMPWNIMATINRTSALKWSWMIFLLLQRKKF